MRKNNWLLLACSWATFVVINTGSVQRSCGQTPARQPVTLAELLIQSNAAAPGDEELNPETDAAAKEPALKDSAAAKRLKSRLAALRKPLSDIRIEATTDADAKPESIAADVLRSRTGNIITASGLSLAGPDRYSVSSAHRPLYFEELNLERCGNTYGYATNAASAIRFLTNVAVLPYRLASERADVTIASHGDCKTHQAYSHDIEPLGCEAKGFAVEAIVVAGVLLLLM